MRGPVATALGIPSKVVWASQGDITFQLLRGDFMKPVIKLGMYQNFMTIQYLDNVFMRSYFIF